jgi:hypothetical protein
MKTETRQILDKAIELWTKRAESNQYDYEVCPFCESASYSCRRCLIFKVFGSCCVPESPYVNWCYSKTKERQKATQHALLALALFETIANKENL